MEKVVDLINRAVDAIELALAHEDLTADELVRLSTAKADLAIAKANVRLRIEARDRQYQAEKP